MHIALYSPAWPPSEHSNGIITYVDHLRGELIRQGHRVSIFTGVLSPSNSDANVQFIQYEKPGLAERAARKVQALLSRAGAPARDRASSWGTLIGRKIHEVHRRDPIDVIEIEESFGWCADVQAATTIPVVVKLHGPAFLDLLDEANTQEGQRKISMEGAALHRMRFITSPSARTLEQTLDHYGLRPELGITVPNPMVPASASQQWSLERCEPRTLLFVGRFDQRKGGDLVLRAFRQLLDSAPELKLVFVGPDRGVPLGDAVSVDFDTFAAAVFTTEQRGQVQYLGKTAPAAIPALRQRAMVTLFASRWDNQPNTILEAMMQSCPVVAIDSGGVGEMVEHGVTGLLSPSGDIDAFCAQVRTLLAQPEQAAEMGRRGRLATAARHDVTQLATQTLEVYRRAIEAYV